MVSVLGKFRCEGGGEATASLRREAVRIQIVSLLILALAVPSAVAHPVPAARVVVELEPALFTLTLDGDIPALVMQAMPGHLGDEQAENLRTMPDKELQSWVEDARKAFTLRTVVAFDGQPVKLEELEFPTLAELRRRAVGHNSDGSGGRIRCCGPLPKGAQTMALTFPADVGPVRLIVRRSGEVLHTLRLAAGQASPALPLRIAGEIEPTSQRTPRIVTVLLLVGGAVGIGLTAALLCRWRLWRSEHASRSCSG